MPLFDSGAALGQMPTKMSDRQLPLFLLPAVSAPEPVLNRMRRALSAESYIEAKQKSHDFQRFFCAAYFLLSFLCNDMFILHCFFIAQYP
jgi:hypothetical protein